MKELSISESTDLIMEIILGGSIRDKRNNISEAKYNPIGDNRGASLSESKDKQEHAKLRIIEQLFEWEKQGYKIVKMETENWRMDFTRFNRLLASSTYRELGLRSKEYLQYLNAGGEEQRLAEVTMYNCMVSFLKDLGMKQRQAEGYCEERDNLIELAQYISSILG